MRWRYGRRKEEEASFPPGSEGLFLLPPTSPFPHLLLKLNSPFLIRRNIFRDIGPLGEEEEEEGDAQIWMWRKVSLPRLLLLYSTCHFRPFPLPLKTFYSRKIFSPAEKKNVIFLEWKKGEKIQCSSGGGGILRERKRKGSSSADQVDISLDRKRGKGLFAFSFKTEKCKKRG